MNFRLISKTLIFIFLISFWACKTEKAQTESQNWSAFRPAEIPYNIRKEAFDKGNIVQNASFEEGVILEKNDSVIKSFDIDAWSVEGINVEWVDTSFIDYDSEHVGAGSRAIRIKRGFGDVKDINNQSEGITSDYIEVIPGNYLFYFDVMMENVRPSCQRLNSKLGTDIDVRIHFYDQDKKEMSAGVYYDYWDKEVDNGFKGFAFSNFYEIEKFDWGKVKARTLNYPFSEGDMPDGCKYVKLYLGFKGSGTVYYDNIDFRLSKWNFTSLERIKPMFDQKYEAIDYVIPTPKQHDHKTKFDLSERELYILLAKKPSVPEIRASELLISKLPEATIIHTISGKEQNNALIFSIGKTDICEHYKNQIDLISISQFEQSYMVRRVKNGNDYILLLSNTSVGSFYAAATVSQLIQKNEKVYHHYNITDYPDFTGRSFLTKVYNNTWTINRDTSLSKDEKVKKIAQNTLDIEQEAKNVDFYVKYKLNKVYNGYGSLSKQWWEPGEIFDDLFKGLGEKSQKYEAVTPCVMINPYFHFEYESEERSLPDSLRNMFVHSKKEDIDKVKNLIDKAVKEGAKTVMICADDFVPHIGNSRGIYALYHDKDKKQFFNMAHAQSYLLNNLNNWMSEKYKEEIRLEFCPAPYLNQFIDYGKGSAEAFFRDLSSHVPKEVPFIWTGNTVRSLAYDMADIKRYSDLIKRKPMLWDNTPYAREIEGQYGGYPAHYPAKAVMNSLFEPYDIIVPKDFYKYMDPHIYSNQTGFEERHKIKYLTFADFAWNSNAYNADFSLYKTLIHLFGKENALTLLEFNDLYYQLVSIWSEIRNKKLSNKNSYNVSQDFQLKIVELKKALNFKISVLNKAIDNESLLKELQAKMDQKFSQIDKLLDENKNAEEKVGNRQT